ncbi:hypothetical protein ASG99_25475 [Bacillus sp. Soil768D1]|nr:hypothetical protein ASG99_25475 [Bacillus sp. Soil768D1]
MVKKEQFLYEVQQFIRSKEAKRFVTDELEFHLKQSTEALKKQGFRRRGRSKGCSTDGKQDYNRPKVKSVAQAESRLAFDSFIFIISRQKTPSSSV